MKINQGNSKEIKETQKGIHEAQHKSEIIQRESNNIRRNHNNQNKSKKIRDSKNINMRIRRQQNEI